MLCCFVFLSKCLSIQLITHFTSNFLISELLPHDCRTANTIVLINKIMGGSYLPLSGTLAAVLPEFLCPFLSLCEQISQLQQPSVYNIILGS